MTEGGIRSVAASRGGAAAADIAVGVGAALLAVGVRWLLPLSPIQLPTLTVVVAIALTSTFRGLAAGLATAVVGGLLSWYLFFAPRSADGWSGLIPLFGFFVIATVIVTTAHLYRLSERRNHEAHLAALRKQAQTSELFARELAHRLKNTLAIVQSIAFQTLGDDGAETGKFAARLRTLADAHDLLSEHVDRPTARAAEVVHRVLQPFLGGEAQVEVKAADVRIASREVLSLALAVHELGTNATLYGAMSKPEGRVSVKIEEAADRIRLTWSEQGGPPVVAPGTTGFGTNLLQRVGSDAELLFSPDGLRCTLYFRRDPEGS